MKKSGFFQSRNPVMNENVFRKTSSEVLDADMTGVQVHHETMTAQGATNKSFILAGVMLLTSVISFAFPNMIFLWGGAIGGLIAVLVATFKPHLSPGASLIYAAFEGLFVGAITAIYASMFNGIVFHAITLTIAMLFLMLFIYKTGIIKVTQRFRMGIMMATGAVFVLYMLSWILSLFGISMPFLHEGGWLGIGLSLLIIGIAAMNLLLDFDNFEMGERYGAPKYMEWFCAMGLLITLVWLYVEILRLLAIISGRD